MRRFNFIRPLLIIAVALLTRSLITSLCLLLGASKETAGNIGFVAMMVAAILIFTRLNKSRNKR
jgi:ABC-type cobalamin transport system permease subunit